MARIRPSDTIEDVVRRYPASVEIFYRHGLPCIACGEPVWGTIEENARKYGVKDLDALLRELNQLAERAETVPHA